MSHETAGGQQNEETGKTVAMLATLLNYCNAFSFGFAVFNSVKSNRGFAFQTFLGVGLQKRAREMRKRSVRDDTTLFLSLDRFFLVRELFPCAAVP